MGTANTSIEADLRALCAQHVASDVLSWFEAFLHEQPLREPALLGAFSAAARRASKEPVTLAGAARDNLKVVGLYLEPVVPKAALVRSWLLCAACARLPQSAHVSLLKRAFQTGDNEERIVVLRTLPVLPEPERFLPLAVEACRTNVLDVFQALARDNPYPADHFPDESFNQLVIKALFMGSPLTRLVRLQERVNPELQRMVRDYAAERRAAHRAIPVDSQLVEPTLEIDA